MHGDGHISRQIGHQDCLLNYHPVRRTDGYDSSQPNALDPRNSSGNNGKVAYRPA
jgi:hypothetical protein